MLNSRSWPIRLLPPEDFETAVRLSTYGRAALFEEVFQVDTLTARMMALCCACKPMILADPRFWSISV